MGNYQNSGTINFGIKQYMNEQFNKVRKDPKREYLTISEVLEIQAHEDYPFDFRHLAILVVCDNDMDGKFCMKDFDHFALWIQLNLVSVQMYQFKSQLQGRATQKLIQILHKREKIDKTSKVKQYKKGKKQILGQDLLTQWFKNVLIHDKAAKITKGVPYIKIQCIKLIFQIFNVKMMTQMDIQSFFYLIKRSSQDLGYPIEQIYEQSQQQDEQYIAICVCEQFIRNFIKGVLKTLNDIGYTQTL